MDFKAIAKNLLLLIAFIISVSAILIGFRWFFNETYGFIQKRLALDEQSLLASLEANSNENEIDQTNEKFAQKALLPIRNWQVGDLELNAESAISVETDLDTQKKILFSKNETKILPIASLTKLMSAVVVFENYNLEDKIIITEESVAQEGEQGNLKAGEILSVKDLLYIMLIESSNDAVHALSSIMGQDLFVSKMNEKAGILGLYGTYFRDSSGLSQESHSTAEDLVKLTEYLLVRYPLILEILGMKEYDLYLYTGELHHKLINTNKLLGEVPEIIGGKTGFTNYAKGSFIVVQKSPREGNYLINVVLKSDDRLEEMKKIINWLNAAYKWEF